MTENAYRFLLGALLFIMLYIESDNMAYALILMALFEGITNWRLNLVVSNILKRINGSKIPARPPNEHARLQFDAERAQRIFIAVLFYVCYFIAPEEYWYISWLFAIAILLSGIVMFCPVVLFRYIGFR